MLTDRDIKKVISGVPRRASVTVAVTSVALATIGVTAVWANSAAEHRPDKVSQQTAALDSKAAWAIPETKLVADDPSTWTLPLMQYQVVGNEANGILLQAAEAKVTAQCLKALGVEAPFHVPTSWSEASASDPSGPKNGMDVRYGDHDLAKVSKYGYGWAADAEEASGRSQPHELSADVSLALEGWKNPLSGDTREGVPHSLNKKAVPPRGCGGKAQEELTEYRGGTDTSEDAVRQLERQAWDGMHADSRTLAVFDKWSTCMRGKGYDYKDPWEANEDPQWAPSGRSDAAIATAKADVSCRQQHSVSEIMHQVETDWQNRLIQQNPETIKEAKEYSDRVMKRVNTTLGR